MNTISSNSQHYYTNIWTQDDQPGKLFWMDADFNIYSYKVQEKVFRSFLYGLKNRDKIKNVLELGAGTGRMTKIVLETFSNSIETYDVLDIDLGNHLEKAKTHLGELYNRVSSWMNLDVTSSKFDKTFFEYDPYRKYDLILATELYMYILPKDIENLIFKVSKLGKNHFVYLDWWPLSPGDAQED